MIESLDLMSAQSVPVVLVVEDDPLQQMLSIEIVEDAGCRALQACDADEAIFLLESQGDISVLFTDIDMPGSMDGIQLADAVHLRWPLIKIILVSGHKRPCENEIPAQSCFIGKPYAAAIMAAQLRLMAGFAV